MSLATQRVASYLVAYATAYRNEYRRLIEPPPAGAGYPALVVSPYLSAGTVESVVASDGVAVYSNANEPEFEWWIAGGPTLLADYEPTLTPPDVVERLKVAGIWGKPIGVYRLVSKSAISAEVWAGLVEYTGPVVEAHVDGVTFRIRATKSDRAELLRRLTFGVFQGILDVKIPESDSPFWFPHIVRRLGFATADRQHRRFFDYLELLHHSDEAAWDERAIPVRVLADVQRDFAWAFGAVGVADKGGSIGFGRNQSLTQPFLDRLTILASTLQAFDTLLTQSSEADENVFHSFISAHPILLDVYGEPVSKPRWHYPAAESPLGKAYIEPDFVLKYTDGSYGLIELERPNKMLATSRGEPRAALNQAAFQIAEWKAYIANHYDLIKREFPGISSRHSATIVISRSSANSYGEGRSHEKYKEILAAQYPGIVIVTYDELLNRARQAYARIASLAPSGLERQRGT